MYFCNGKTVYAQNSDEYRENSGFPSPKGPGSMFSSSFLLPDGHHNSSELWSPTGGIGQANYGAVPTPATSHMSQANGYNNIHPHDRLSYSSFFAPTSPGLNQHLQFLRSHATISDCFRVWNSSRKRIPEYSIPGISIPPSLCCFSQPVHSFSRPLSRELGQIFILIEMRS